MQIDARGPRFGAVVTTAVLATAISAGPGALGTALLAVQTLAFGIGAIVGPQAQPYGRLYAAFIRPRLSGPVPLEDVAPPRFAQAVGLAFAVTALIGAVTGVTALFVVPAAFALAAAFLNAAFDFCLGCEIYLRVKRVRFAA